MNTEEMPSLRSAADPTDPDRPFGDGLRSATASEKGGSLAASRHEMEPQVPLKNDAPWSEDGDKPRLTKDKKVAGMTMWQCVRNRIRGISFCWVLLLCGLMFKNNVYAQVLTNANFETPVLSDLFRYSPAINAEQPWSFTGQCGLAKDGGDPNNSFAVAETNYPGQYAFLQMTYSNGSSIKQPVLFVASGIFQLMYQEAGRQRCPSGAGGGLRYEVCISNTVSGIAALCITNQTSTDQCFSPRTYSVAIDSPGLYNLTFRTIGHAGSYSDNAALFDAVSISKTVICLIHVENGQTVGLSWNSASNELFRVQKNSVLQDDRWINVGSVIQSTGNVTSASVPMDLQDQACFYRVQTIMP